ncbi:MAG TPA: molybdenum cofactor biosynthesis protein MoaE [Candidatus Methylacidiphilales bacterium]|jgi:molybdopterin synthase catalytic subunit|nr:molybdenum cofactor biosynthesis protein MoaE [Candidatus Methylacidiphilales bacterium]
MTLDILLQCEPIVLKTDVPPEAGAVVRLEGRVRADEQGRAIRALIYEAYQPMAERQIEKILRELGAQHPCLSVCVRHRLGEVPVGETAIVMETLAAHRAEAFALTSAFMDRLKQDVPIWKMKAVEA